jgi:hypothetical protein
MNGFQNLIEKVKWWVNGVTGGALDIFAYAALLAIIGLSWLKA